MFHNAEKSWGWKEKEWGKISEWDNVTHSMMSCSSENSNSACESGLLSPNDYVFIKVG